MREVSKNFTIPVAGFAAVRRFTPPFLPGRRWWLLGALERAKLPAQANAQSFANRAEGAAQKAPCCFH